MSAPELAAVAQAMVAPGKGILAADESTGTIEKRFAGIKVESTEENRRAYRDMLFTTKGLGQYISGVILYDETIRQKSANGALFVELLANNGILPGIKVDTGAKDLALCAGEKVTEGLDNLAKRCAEYAKMGAKFAKWRAVISIGQYIPSSTCIAASAHALGRYAAICQAAGLVPIVEPEVLMDGDHTVHRCEEVTEWTLNAVYEALYLNRVTLEHSILKPSMVIAGKDCTEQAGVEEVAERTVRILKRTVPAAVAGIVFLSGGQSDEVATAHLNAMNQIFAYRLPWPLSFSYGRALQQPSLKAWKGAAANVAAAQSALLHRAHMNSLACLGRYSANEEKQALAA
ncbi:MAG: fructose-bisphosphate aldolase [Betaproteobacteria bacterium RIFCSPLOWO2_12_FULL_62_13]|nr:MAG: fructose-bisphosphate aldolase [Betaproteobacteria bacterium RIFCSPLOWO2_12_FULL_62_13]